MWVQPRVPQLRLGGAEDAAVVLQVGAAVAGVLHVQRVIQQVQVFLDLGDVLCGVLLRVQDLREARGVRLRDRREETARPPGTLPPASPCRPQASRRGLQSPGHLAQLSPQPGKPAPPARPSEHAAMLRQQKPCGGPSGTRMRGCPPGAPAPRQPPGPRTGPLPGGRTRRNPSACSLPSLVWRCVCQCVSARARPQPAPPR